MAPIDGALAQANANDRGRLSSYFTSRAVIIDDFGPFTWQGHGAAARWLGDVDDYNSLARSKNWHLTARDLQTLEIDAGQTAYVVVPVNVTFEVDGRFLRRARPGALSLTHAVGVWKITSATGSHKLGNDSDLFQQELRSSKHFFGLYVKPGASQGRYDQSL